jgi:hypothetical protein
VNDSSQTRREQVLTRLRASFGDWVDGPELANAKVGGSEGLKRLRELRAEGHVIEMRRHPSIDRAIWQYRLVEHAPPKETPRREANPPKIVFGELVPCARCKGKGKDPIKPKTQCIRCSGAGFRPPPG